MQPHREKVLQYLQRIPEPILLYYRKWVAVKYTHHKMHLKVCMRKVYDLKLCTNSVTFRPTLTSAFHSIIKALFA